MKLNLGAGDIKLGGYINLDIKNGDSIYPLNYEDESIDVLRASHVLEHFSFRETLKVLLEWNRVLKQDGVIKIAVPDFNKLLTDYTNHPMFEGYIYGGQIDEYDYHKALFTEGKLTGLLWDTGFHRFSKWESEVEDCAALPLSLNIQAIKSYGIINTNER